MRATEVGRLGCHTMAGAGAGRRPSAHDSHALLRNALRSYDAALASWGPPTIGIDSATHKMTRVSAERSKRVGTWSLREGHRLAGTAVIGVSALSDGHVCSQ